MMGAGNNSGMTDRLREFRMVLEQSKRIVGFTGAGISTESGIPDYRSQGGIWQSFQPVYLDEFIADPQKRILYWQRKKEMWQGIRNAQPGPTHKFFNKLYGQGCLHGLITQNIDGLHEKSGLPAEVLVNLHGSNLEVACLSCDYLVPAHEILDDLDLDTGVPLCPQCQGLLKPNTISFGQQLREADLQRAGSLAVACDLMIAAGSSLVVEPAASFPRLAKNNGAVLAIITQSATPLDSAADFVFNVKLGDFLHLITGELHDCQ
jgi:NAD-dependent deacetylase